MATTALAPTSPHVLSPTPVRLQAEASHVEWDSGDDNVAPEDSCAQVLLLGPFTLQRPTTPSAPPAGVAHPLSYSTVLSHQLGHKATLLHDAFLVALSFGYAVL